MSERIGKFCDFTRTVDGVCTKQAIGTCVFCEQDVCNVHAIHEMSGLLVRVDLREIVTPQGVNQQPQTITLVTGSDTAVVCRTCANQIRQHISVAKVSAAAKAATIKAMRVALTNRALRSED